MTATMPYELFTSPLRYLFARRKQAFISVISLVSMLGVAVGVMALVIALALMTGPAGRVRDRMLGSQAARLRLQDRRASPTTTPRSPGCCQVPDVLGAAPALMGKALVSTASDGVHHHQGHRSGARAQVTEIARGDARAAASTALDRGGDDELPGILIGHELAGQLGGVVGDTVTVLTPNGTLSPMGVMPRPAPAEGGRHLPARAFEFDSASAS